MPGRLLANRYGLAKSLIEGGTVDCCGRRQVLVTSGMVASAVLVSGCGSSTGEGASPAATGTGGGDGLAAVDEVPVGGGLVVQTAQVVITQPREGEFKAFSAVCPHQGCLVTGVQDGEIVCPCHGSRFAADTGDVVAGPATRGLEEKRVTVADGAIDVS